MSEENKQEKTGRKKCGRKKAIQIDEQTGMVIYNNDMQKEFIERYLIAPHRKTAEEWAKEFNVSVYTIYSWRKFARLELNRVLKEETENIKQDLSRLANKAFDGIEDALDSRDENLRTATCIKVFEMLGINNKNPVNLDATISLLEFQQIYMTFVNLIRKYFGKSEYKDAFDAFSKEWEQTIYQWREMNNIITTN